MILDFSTDVKIDLGLGDIILTDREGIYMVVEDDNCDYALLDLDDFDVSSPCMTTSGLEDYVKDVYNVTRIIKSQNVRISEVK